MGDRDAIRIRLATNRLTHIWLIYQLHLRGIETDKSEFSSILAGTRKGDKAENIINEANWILDNYEEYWVERVVAG